MDDREMMRKRILGDIRGSLEPERDYEVRYARNDGAMIWAHASLSRIEYEGKPAYQVLLVDITKWKETESEE